MIKALIVDDEKLVRRGLISMMPWAKYGVDIVGEAAHGRIALEIMAYTEVDLIFTDLVMPEMSGFELIQAVQIEHPETSFVILTCHEDFGFAKEAIRLGALDYIVKNDLEIEIMDEVLERVVTKYHAINKSDKAKSGALSDSGYLIYDPDGSELASQQLEEWAAYGQSHRIDKNVIFLEVEVGTEKIIEHARTLLPKCVVIEMFSLNGKSLPEKLRLASTYKNNEFFYAHWNSQRLIKMDLNEIKPIDENKIDIEAVKRRAFTLGWIYLETEFQEFMNSIQELQPPPASLKAIIYQFIVQYGHLFASMEAVTEWMAQLTDKDSWIHLEQHLNVLRALLLHNVPKGHIPEEIASGILRAIQYIQQHDNFDFTQNDLAVIANMSRSYFSINFKAITGKTFIDYMRDLRLAKAKRLLWQTNKPIYWIAEQVGLKDERYFSRLFHEHVGMLPSDFRNGKLGP